jgi:hypothetical protein
VRHLPYTYLIFNAKKYDCYQDNKASVTFIVPSLLFFFVRTLKNKNCSV